MWLNISALAGIMFLKNIFTISTSCVQHSELRLVLIALQYINNKQKTSKLNLYRNPISLTKKNIFLKVHCREQVLQPTVFSNQSRKINLEI